MSMYMSVYQTRVYEILKTHTHYINKLWQTHILFIILYIVNISICHKERTNDALKQTHVNIACYLYRKVFYCLF